MSEQIQSLLNEMENKFEESFSESIHEEPISNSLNPQSAKKTEIKHEHTKITTNSNLDDLHQMKNLLLEELNEHNDEEYKNDENEQQNKREDQTHQHEQIHAGSLNLTSQKTLNFESKDEYEQLDLDDLRKVASQQQFSNSCYQPPSQNGQGGFYYKELTMKLQKALMKISSDKAVGPVRKSYNFYDRVQQFEQKKKREIQRRKQQLQEKQISSVQDRPLINSHSRALVAQVSNDPIYVRCEKILERKKEKEEQNKRVKQNREGKEYEEFKLQFQSYMNEVKQKYEGKTIRTSEEYYHEQQIWIKAKEKNLQSKIIQQNEKIKSQITFKPLINSKSQKIIQNKKQQKRVPIFDRQPKLKEQAKDPNCTFKPKINKNNFYKKMTYYQAPF